MQFERGSAHFGRGLLIVVALLVVAALGLSACGGGSSSTGSDTQESPGSEESTGTKGGSEKGEESAGAALVAEPEPNGFPLSEGGESNPELIKEALVEKIPKAQLTSAYEEAFGKGYDFESGLAPWAKNAYEIALQKPTKEQEEFVLECVHTSTCKRDSGDLVIAYPDDFGANSWRRENYIGTVYALARYPQVKEVIHTEAAGDLQTLQSNIRSAISQGADAIIGDYDAGDAVLPQIREARAAGIPEIAVSQGLPSAQYDGSDLNWLLNQNLCQLGYNLGGVAAESAPDAKVAMFTGIPGNPFAAGWQPCAEEAIEKGGATIQTHGTTEWTEQGNAQAASALLAEGVPNAVIYDQDMEQFEAKFISAGLKELPSMAGFLNQGSYEVWKQQKDKGNEFPLYSTTTQNSNSFLAAYLAVAAAEEMVPPELEEGQIENPTGLLDGEELEKQYVKGGGSTAAFGSLLPENILIASLEAK